MAWFTHVVTCGLTACTPGSAPGPTLGDEYGKTLPFYFPQIRHRQTVVQTDESQCAAPPLTERVADEQWRACIGHARWSMHRFTSALVLHRCMRTGNHSPWARLFFLTPAVAAAEQASTTAALSRCQRVQKNNSRRPWSTTVSCRPEEH